MKGGGGRERGEKRLLEMYLAEIAAVFSDDKCARKNATGRYKSDVDPISASIKPNARGLERFFSVGTAAMKHSVLFVVCALSAQFTVRRNEHAVR